MGTLAIAVPYVLFVWWFSTGAVLLLTGKRALGLVLTTATAVGLAYAAGKIFRVGLLMQGKGATLGEMWRWVRAS